MGDMSSGYAELFSVIVVVDFAVVLVVVVGLGAPVLITIGFISKFRLKSLFS
jgi:hypothetical protein